MNMPKNKDDRSEVLADIQQAAARQSLLAQVDALAESMAQILLKQA